MSVIISQLMKEIPITPDSRKCLPQRRVVVTGMEAITPLGLNLKDTWKNLIAGESGIVPINIPFTEVKIAGVVDGFDPKIALEGFVVPMGHLKRLSRAVQLSLGAAIGACRDAGLLNGNKLKEAIDPVRVGVSIGTGIGGAPHISDVNERIKRGDKLDNVDALIMEPERVASVPSMKIGTKGEVEMVSGACASGNLAITHGYKSIYMGDADIMIVGGAESMLNAGIIQAFYATGALANETDPKEAYRASRPFDKTRKGFVISEGAAILILEEREHAIKREAKIYAEMVGYGNTADAGSDTAPSGEGAERALKLALEKAGEIPADGVIYIHGHATGTQKDPTEIEAIRKTVIDNHNKTLISSTKGSSGHLVGAAGALGSIFGIKAMLEKEVPPTLNLNDPVDEAKGIDLVPNKSKKVEEKIVLVLSNSLGFGGMNSVTGFKPFEDIKSADSAK
jgi:3-oxoacyl-[acyl-carrier-protein] synthase II